MKDVFDELEEFLQKADAEFTIKVNGMVPNIKGHGNDAGVIMAAFGALKILENTGKSFDEIVDMMNDLNSIMKYQIIDRSEVKNET